MKISAALLVFVLVVPPSSFSQSVPGNRRDGAIKEINNCLRRNDVSSRECRNLNQNIETLIDVFKTGDKSVLPVLLHFTYLTNFFADALMSDPNGFLTAMAGLPENDQRAVAVGLAGGAFSPLPKPRYEAIRDLLLSIPDRSPTSNVAKLCVREVQTNNASLYLDYFPPGTLTGRAATFTVYWFSRDLYSLGEKPLPPEVRTNATIYRFTYLGAFSGPMSVTLNVMPDGGGTVIMKSASESRDALATGDSLPVSQAKVSQFVQGLQRADFWHMPPDVPSTGMDGAEWILEGVRSGEYHVAFRRCPGDDGRTPNSLAFAESARLLLEFAGHKHSPGC